MLRIRWSGAWPVAAGGLTAAAFAWLGAMWLDRAALHRRLSADYALVVGAVGFAAGLGLTAALTATRRTRS